MLHLSLAGNILRAVGGTPKLYDPHIIPQYPMLMPGRIPDLELNLRMMTKENLQTFIDVRPHVVIPSLILTLFAHVQVESPAPQNPKPEADEYHTLGQFYEAIKRGKWVLVERVLSLFRWWLRPGISGPHRQEFVPSQNSCLSICSWSRLPAHCSRRRWFSRRHRSC